MSPIPFEKQTYIFKVVDGVEIPADVYRAVGVEVAPVVLWVHGGALIFGARSRIRPYQVERYLQAGFTVVAMDYRLAPETKLPQIIEDLRDAYGWVLAEGPTLFGLDGERVAVVGHSAGGYLALMTGFAVEPRPKAIVSFYGYGDLTGAWYSRPDPFYCQQPMVTQEVAQSVVGKGVVTEDSAGERWPFYLYCRQNGLWPLHVGGHDPDAEREWFAPYCPLRNVDRAYPPVLLLHGDQDTDVPYQQSVLMAEAFAEHQVEHRLITIQEGGHGFDRGEDRPDDPAMFAVFDEVVDFLKKHCQV